MPRTLPRGLAAYPITPADAQGRIDIDAMQRLLAPLADAGVDAVGLLGSTGTYAYLSRGERRRAIIAAREALGPAMTLLVGIGALRTDDACALARDAQEAGADAGLLAPMSYTPLSEDEVFAHYQAVAAASTLPLCVYDNPSTTHFSVGTGLFARLAALPEIIAIKTGAPTAADLPARHASLRAALPARVSLGYSVDANAAAAMLAGGDLWHSVLAGIAPRICVALTRAAMAGDAAAVASLDGRLRPLWDLFISASSLRVCYALASRMGLTDAVPPLPIRGLDSAALTRLDAVCREIDLA